MAQQSPAFETALALSRFGLGAGTDGVAAVSGDIRERLKAEIASGAPTLPALRASPDILVDVYQYQAAKQAERQAMKTAPAPAPVPVPAPPATDMTAMAPQPAPKPQKPGADLDNLIRQSLLAEIDGRFNGTVKSPEIGFNERMVMFWMNHFAVSTKKSQPVEATTGAYEREAIRPHVFGRFYDLLVAVETHPSMLLYLDNEQSIGPHSQANKNGKRGLNENLAREIMELHTLGVGSGYSQSDVTAFARVITGWGVNRNDKNGPPGTFVFNARAHEPGAQEVMGRAYAQDGVDQGKAVLADLARHPATARHIAFKLARHFVADTPPPALVSRLSDTFLKSDGDLAAVSQALINAPEAWTPQRQKIRSPLEYLCAAIRATGATLKPNAITTALNAMGEPLWQPAGPNGFPDTADAWASPESLSTRLDFVNGLALAADPSVDPRQFAESRLGALLSDHTREAVARAESHAQGLSLAFLSPEFMRR